MNEETPIRNHVQALNRQPHTRSSDEGFFQSEPASGEIFNCVLRDTHDQSTRYIREYASQFRDQPRGSIASQAGTIADLAVDAVRTALFLNGDVPVSVNAIKTRLNGIEAQTAFSERLQRSSVPPEQRADAIEVFDCIVQQVAHRAEMHCNSPILFR